jgi:hypothetical protein
LPEAARGKGIENFDDPRNYGNPGPYGVYEE